MPSKSPSKSPSKAPSNAPRKAGSRVSSPAITPVPVALTAARRALDQQTALVTKLEARVRELTARQTMQVPVVDPHVVLADTVIYWRHRRSNRW